MTPRFELLSVDPYTSFQLIAQGMQDRTTLTTDEETRVAAALSAYLNLCYQLTEWIRMWGMPSPN